jgi:2-dehydropantoate 2-reductase
MEIKRPVILILGAGSVGLALAGRLAAVAEVHAVCRKQHAASIRDRGLVMEGIWGNRTVRGIRCITDPAEGVPLPDYSILTAKGTDTREICRAYAGALEGRPAVSLQNGIGNEEILAEYAGCVIGGTVTTNFSVTGPGSVRVKSESAPVRLGVYPGTDRGRAPCRLDGLLSLFADAGIAAGKSGDIRADIWNKSLLNIAVNPLSALLGVPVGALAADPLFAIMDAMIREAFAVGRAEGIALPWDGPDAYLTYLRTVQIPDFADAYPSMYHDLVLGRPTEIDLLNGRIGDLGRRHGIPTPCNDCIANLIRYREAGGAGTHP